MPGGRCAGRTLRDLTEGPPKGHLHGGQKYCSSFDACGYTRGKEATTRTRREKKAHEEKKKHTTHTRTHARTHRERKKRDGWHACVSQKRASKKKRRRRKKKKIGTGQARRAVGARVRHARRPLRPRHARGGAAASRLSVGWDAPVLRSDWRTRRGTSASSARTAPRRRRTSRGGWGSRGARRSTAGSPRPPPPPPRSRPGSTPAA